MSSFSIRSLNPSSCYFGHNYYNSLILLHYKKPHKSTIFSSYCFYTIAVARRYPYYNLYANRKPDGSNLGAKDAVTAYCANKEANGNSDDSEPEPSRPANKEAKGASDNSNRESSRPDKSGLSAWKKWMMGLVLSMVLPSFRHKWGPLMILKDKMNTAIETVETVAEVVEDLAEVVESLADEIEDRLPEKSKLKEAAEIVENLGKEADKQAELAQDLIEKVRDIQEEFEAALENVGDHVKFGKERSKDRDSHAER